MNAIKGMMKNGQIVFDDPPDWPDGMEVFVEPADSFGMSEDEQGDDPESIARWLAAFDSIEPMQMSPEEEAAWAAARQAQKEFEKRTFDERAERLRRMME